MRALRIAVFLCSTVAFAADSFGQAAPTSAVGSVRRVVSAPPNSPGPEVLPYNYQIGVTMTEAGKPAADLSVVVAQPDTAFKVDLHQTQDEKTDPPAGSALFAGTMRVEPDGKVFVTYAISREIPVVVSTQVDLANPQAPSQRNYQFKSSTLQGSARVTPGIPLNIGKSGMRVYTLTVTQLTDGANAEHSTAPNANAVATPQPSYATPVGVWRWFVGPDITIKEDGTAELETDRGRWAWTDKERRRFEIMWEKKNLVDSLTLSLDGRKVSGANTRGVRVTGERIK